MFIPNPILTVLTTAACKIICDTVLDDDKDRSATMRVIHDHDTIDAAVMREIIREELKEHEDHEN